jgi:hypothetical protein
MILKTIVCMLAIVSAGQASASDYLSRSETPSTPDKLAFVVPATGMRATIVVYENSVDCSQMHVIENEKLGVDETIYVPRSRFVTFNVHLARLSGLGIKTGDVMYTVPFDSGDVRVNVDYDDKRAWASIESHTDQGWRPAEGTAQRKFTRPFFGNDWCPADQAFADK